MPPALALRDFAWGAGWAAFAVVTSTALWGIPQARLVQHIIQFGLLSLALLPLGLLGLNFLPRQPLSKRIPLRWQVVGLLLIVSILAGPPWNSATIGCPDC